MYVSGVLWGGPCTHLPGSLSRRGGSKGQKAYHHVKWLGRNYIYTITLITLYYFDTLQDNEKTWFTHKIRYNTWVLTPDLFSVNSSTSIYHKVYIPPFYTYGTQTRDIIISMDFHYFQVCFVNIHRETILRVKSGFAGNIIVCIQTIQTCTFIISTPGFTMYILELHYLRNRPEWKRPRCTTWIVL